MMVCVRVCAHVFLPLCFDALALTSFVRATVLGGCVGIRRRELSASSWPCFLLFGFLLFGLVCLRACTGRHALLAGAALLPLIGIVVDVSQYLALRSISCKLELALRIHISAVSVQVSSTPGICTKNIGHKAALKRSRLKQR